MFKKAILRVVHYFILKAVSNLLQYENVMYAKNITLFLFLKNHKNTNVFA